MNVADALAPRASVCLLVLVIACVLSAGPYDATFHPAAAQAAESPPAARDEAKVAEGEQAADAALAAEREEDSTAEDGAEGTASVVASEINLLELVLKGGYLMFPIAAISLLVVTLFVERLLGLRRRKVLPPELVGGLGRLAEHQGGFDPRRAYRLCQQYPSAAANVIKTMLLKVGRPHRELEHAVSEANDREAARLYANVRWLSLAAGVTPLIGLLGTVWGMIKAFYATANLPTGANKAQTLADGIYVALVTTAAGLSVAIPAAIAAHLFEGRIQKLFRELDETLLGLMPQLERFEGRLRMSKDTVDVPAGDGSQSLQSASHPSVPTPK
ncbi:MAG: MotA/TolQ/ExbB proton channel family protein [Planctomycetota bacterium]|jgi:biopolymer transport protein ExbB